MRCININVDWTKAEENPSLKQKVEGRDLLNLRSKINSLEIKLREREDELKKVRDELKENKSRVNS